MLATAFPSRTNSTPLAPNPKRHVIAMKTMALLIMAKVTKTIVEINEQTGSCATFIDEPEPFLMHITRFCHIHEKTKPQGRFSGMIFREGLDSVAGDSHYPG